MSLIVNLGCQSEVDEGGIVGSSFRTKFEYFIFKEQYSDAIHKLNESDVRTEVKAALLQGDSRWMGVYEDTLVLPGLEEDSILSTPPASIWVFPGTSDAVPLEAEAWQSAATKYAWEYNQILKMELQDQAKDLVE